MGQALAGYAAEIRLIEQDIPETGGIEALNEPADTSGLPDMFIVSIKEHPLPGIRRGSARAIDRAIPLLAHPGDLCLLKANVAFKLHQFANVQSALRAVPSVYHSDEGRLIRADLDFQLGRYQTAKIRYCAVLKTERSWGALARLAYFCGKMGDPAGADELYEEAQDDLTAKEMRAFAWLEVQRGFLDFARGHDREAQSHYDRAEAAYPASFTSGRVRRSVRASRCGRLSPPILESARRGEVHYWHHLADYYADVAKDGSQAVVWARRDLQLRVNFSTQAALAWASYRDGRFAEARDWIDRALSSGVATAHLFSQAGKIYAGGGSRSRSAGPFGPGDDP